MLYETGAKAQPLDWKQPVSESNLQRSCTGNSSPVLCPPAPEPKPHSWPGSSQAGAESDVYTSRSRIVPAANNEWHIAWQAWRHCL